MPSAIESPRDVVEMHRFRRIVADAPRRSQKNHRRGNFFREDHGIMSRARRHAMVISICVLNGKFDLLHYKSIHSYVMLFEAKPPRHRNTASIADFIIAQIQVIE